MKGVMDRRQSLWGGFGKGLLRPGCWKSLPALALSLAHNLPTCFQDKNMSQRQVSQKQLIAKILQREIAASSYH